MKKRRLLAIAAFVAPLVLVGIACSFPDVTFGPGANGGEGGVPETGTSDAPTNTPDGSVTDAETPDVVRREDGSAPIEDASICAALAKCDCDGDEFADINCDVDASGLLSAKGNLLKPGDCDDLDGFRFPGQTFVEEVPAAGKDGNWNCASGVEYYPPQQIQCGGGALGCTGGPGFIAAPGCGIAADYYQCVKNGLGPCIAQAAGYQTTQACK